MSPLRVLIGCETSGRVRDAFRARGHDAWSCDLLPSARPSPFHIQWDVLHVVREGGPWDVFIVHPPCTFLSSSGMHWTSRGLRDPALTDAALSLVRDLMAAPVEKIALENPIGVISSRIRKPDQILQPWQFGEDASKATCLWLKNLSRLMPTKIARPRLIDEEQEGVLVAPVGKNRWSNQTDSGQNRLAPSADRWALRSETYPGIAVAMAEQWSPMLRRRLTA